MDVEGWDLCIYSRDPPSSDVSEFQVPVFLKSLFISLWEDRHLPPPSDGYGRYGLLALQEYQQQRYGVPLNFLDDWQNQIDHLLAQEEAYQHQLPEDLRNVLLQKSA